MLHRQDELPCRAPCHTLCAPSDALITLLLDPLHPLSLYKDQYGTRHGPSVVLWMDQGFDRQTYYFQKIFANQAMLRKDWYYGMDWYETWLSYEQPDWTLEQSSQALYVITTEICGWKSRIEDWTAGVVADEGSSSAAPAQVRMPSSEPTSLVALAHSRSTHFD